MPKRTRAGQTDEGLAAGAQLERDKLFGSDSLWGWVGTEAKTVVDITLDHRLRTCGLSPHNKKPFCANIYAKRDKTKQKTSEHSDDDVIVVSDTPKPACSKKLCKSSNPNCLNYLGQDLWENDGKEAWESYLKLLDLGQDPSLNSREADTPVGLRNLGATCYANAYLQVWFQNLTFRYGVYSCRPIAGLESNFWNSPIYHLQFTFSALESSLESVFNPEKLVESLQLRITEQQDAQEFAKLFISHLDSEFAKQPDEELRNLVTEQFSGKQIYGTICSACQHTSQTETDFYEIEVNLTENAKLEECIQSALHNETLSGDNQYLCSQCSSLQDATRFTQLKVLPPVLHISLLRFFYDFKSMGRKKSKHAITFPSTLDMTQFVPDHPNQIYELRGILLHKGASAHHGHYEAQIFDIKTQKWYQMNDEIISHITHLGDKPAKSKDVVVDDSDSSARPVKKRRKVAPKKKKKANGATELDDSDGDKQKPQLEITSKDAYMLIYTRREEAYTLRQPGSPPSWAQEAVNGLNKAHKDSCAAYETRLDAGKNRFTTLCHFIQNIYNSWQCASDQDEFILVNRQSLESWLSSGAMESDIAQFQEEQGIGKQPTNSKLQVKKPKVAKANLVCEHGHLKPGSGDLKRIQWNSLPMLMEKGSSSVEPHFSSSDICEACTQYEFLERLYRIEHPKAIRRFEQLDGVSEHGYWISTQWLKDWKCIKPKMHVAGQGDPAPDADPYNRHVRCEHGGLAFNAMMRRKISPEACAILQELFSSWEPLDIQSELCSICEVSNTANQAAKQKAKVEADREKGLMRTLLEAAKGSFALLENVPCSVIPSDFLREWKGFILRPNECRRPTQVDTDAFFCEHGQLCFDPNISSDMSNLVVIKREDWQILEGLYSCGPAIHLEKRVMSDASTRFFHDIEVCSGCRTRRHSDFDSTVIIVRVLDKDTSVSVQDSQVGSRPDALDSDAKGGTRKSKRLRQGKNRIDHRKLTVSKSTTVKDIKVILQTTINIPTIAQRLFYKGQELEDGDATVASLSILMGDILEMKEVEQHEPTSDDDETRIAKKFHQELGFSGTLLSGGPLSGLDTAMGEPLEEACPDEVKTCVVCTYANSLDATRCSICDTALEL